MNGRSRWFVGFALVLAALVVGGVAYNAGVSQGLAMSASTAAAAPGTPGAVPYYWHRPWGFGFFPFGFFPFGFLLLWFLLARAMFWGGGWRRRWYHPGPYDVPPSFDDWHRRAHERMSAPQPEQRA